MGQSAAAIGTDIGGFIGGVLNPVIGSKDTTTTAAPAASTTGTSSTTLIIVVIVIVIIVVAFFALSSGKGKNQKQQLQNNIKT